LILGNRSKPLDSRNVTIKNNLVRDTSFNKYGAYPYAIDITNEGLGRFDNINIIGNRIENKSSLAENMGGIVVKGKGPVTNVRIKAGNRFVNLKRTERQISYSGLEKHVTVESPQH